MSEQDCDKKEGKPQRDCGPGPEPPCESERCPDRPESRDEGEGEAEAAAGEVAPGVESQVRELTSRIAELEDQVEAQREEIARVSGERDTWQSKATALFDQYTRVRSDFEGFRKRTERDFEDRLIREKSDLIKDLLEVMDNFERFLKAAEKTGPSGDASFAAFRKGVLMIQRQLMDVLLREGVEPIESPVGKEMNPEYHDAAVAQEGGGEHGIVVEELQTGYMYRGTVLRPTKVKVVR